jgi:hypothetical protein
MVFPALCVHVRAHPCVCLECSILPCVHVCAVAVLRLWLRANGQSDAGELASSGTRYVFCEEWTSICIRCASLYLGFDVLLRRCAHDASAPGYVDALADPLLL